MNDNRQTKRFRPTLGAEWLEDRQLLATSPAVANIAPITIKAAALSPPPVASVATMTMSWVPFTTEPVGASRRAFRRQISAAVARALHR